MAICRLVALLLGPIGPLKAYPNETAKNTRAASNHFKVAQNWQNDFERKVEELMDIVTKVDTDNNVQSSEILDVYANPSKPNWPKKKNGNQANMLFTFQVFRN